MCKCSRFIILILKYLDKNNIALGIKLNILQKEIFDNSITI